MPALQALWKQHFPNDPVNIFYQNTVFDGYFRGVDNITNLMTATASLAILLAAFGIFGLAMLRISRRVRELSIRRVLGAGAWHFGRLVSGEFLGLLLIASVPGIGLGVVMMRAVMGMFSPGHVMAPVMPVLLTVGLLFAVTLGACGFHLWRVWRLNPVDTLKDE
jgi:putative ABC transport system permease protein